MDYRIFNVRTWSCICVCIHMGVGHTDSESAQHFWLGKTHKCFFGSWCRRDSNLRSLDLESDALSTEQPRHHTGCGCSALKCGSEDPGFESDQSHVGFFSLHQLLLRAGSGMGSMGRLGDLLKCLPHLSFCSGLTTVILSWWVSPNSPPTTPRCPQLSCNCKTRV